ncbi:hypothetical protein DW083_04660 [Parabacteroides sp. AF48-14]|nr:hypothetical protein DW083_04660 [Parabacteroides sp. AF48-14]
MFVLPDADFADNADERRSFIVLKENKSAFLCVICARLRPVNTSKRTDKSSFTLPHNSKTIYQENRTRPYRIKKGNLHRRLPFYR